MGKTYRLLQAVHDLHQQHGVDVLIGYVETYGRAGIQLDVHPTNLADVVAAPAYR